jgi:hypothetical protein
MRINVDRASAGFPSEKNEKPGKITPSFRSDAASGAQTDETRDELELTNRRTAILDSVRETNMAAVSSTESAAGNLSAIKQRLASLNNYIQENPIEALSAHANLDPETVARLIG